MTAKQLKNSILQQAIQGKLIKQNKEDEPASELLKRIKAEREKLIKSGKIKINKNISAIYRKGNSFYEKIENEEICIDEELPFEIPKTWEWLRLGELCTIINGFTPLRTNPKFWENPTISWFTVNDIHSQGRRIKYTKQSINKCALSDNSSRILPAGTVLICCTASVGEYAITEIPLTTNQQFNGLIINEYYSKYYSSEFLFKIAPTFKAKLFDIAGKTTFNFISVQKLSNLLLPFPPIEEQKRIVNKLNQLMPLIEEYEEKENKLNELDKKFPERLKKSILKEAVEGKLINQNKEDEPASELLKRIKAEREKLIKSGKIKPNKNISAIYRKGNSFYEKIENEEICIDEELPFEIPKTWEWVYFKDIVYYSMGKTPPRKEKEYWENPKFAWISIADLVSNGFIYETKEKVNQYSVDKIFKNKISVAGTLLMSFKLTVGKVSILGIDAYHNEAIISIYPFVNDKNIMRDYLFFILPLISQYGNIKSAIKGNTLNSDSLDLLYIPLPPIEEQKRIVEKLDKLINACEELKKILFI